eukprot:3924053-Rhodomonas_salina.2
MVCTGVRRTGRKVCRGCANGVRRPVVKGVRMAVVRRGVHQGGDRLPSNIAHWAMLVCYPFAVRCPVVAKGHVTCDPSRSRSQTWSTLLSHPEYPYLSQVFHISYYILMIPPPDYEDRAALPYPPTGEFALFAYDSATGCPAALVLCNCYAMSGTDSGYAATRSRSRAYGEKLS